MHERFDLCRLTLTFASQHEHLVEQRFPCGRGRSVDIECRQWLAPVGGSPCNHGLVNDFFGFGSSCNPPIHERLRQPLARSPLFLALLLDKLQCGLEEADVENVIATSFPIVNVPTQVLGANGIFMDAFYTDVRPDLAAWRESRGFPADPMKAFADSGYLAKIAEERVGGVQAGWGA